MARKRRIQKREVELDRLIRVNWSDRKNLSIFCGFVNMDSKTHVLAYDRSAEYKARIQIQESLDLGRDMSYVLGAISSDRNDRDTYARSRVEQVLNSAGVYVEINHSSHGLMISGRNALESLWLKFIFEILATNFGDRLIQCPACLRWIVKHRANQIFCGKRCKDYYYLYMKGV